MDPASLHIDPDITKAKTLDTAIYSDSSLYQLSLDQVFARSWQVVEARWEDEHHNVLPFTFLSGALNEPLVLIRKGPSLRCFSNVGTHRSNLLPGFDQSDFEYSFTDNTEMEDEKVAFDLQSGVRSRFYRHGRFSPKHETEVYHFRRLLAHFLKIP